MRRDGFLFLRGLLSTTDVQRARAVALDALRKQKDIGKKPIPCNVDQMTGLLDRQDVAHSEELKRVLESEKLQNLAEILLGNDGNNDVVEVVKYKWLRAVAKGKYTGFHIDRTYLTQVFQTDQILSCWIPLGDITPENGALCCSKTHNKTAERIVKECQGKSLESDGTASGWVQLGPKDIDEIAFESRNFEMGDVVIFGMDMLHATAINTLDELRLSCDVRFIKSEKRPKKRTKI